jgi:lipopolysaccharide biosynthesis glycosyltransferase
LFLSEILKDVEKIAYFDSDVYFNCDVAEFYNFDLSQNYIAGSRDLWCAK